MNFKRPFRLAIWVISVCVLLCLTGCSYRAGNQASLDQTENVRLAATDPANFGKPVRIQGVVTYYDPDWHLLFLQDSTGGIFVNLKEGIPGIDVGRLIEVTGKLAPSNVGIEDAVFNVLGSAPMPAPQPTPDFSVGNSPRLSQWVEVRGIIHSAFFEDGRLTLIIVNGEHRTKVRVLHRQHLSPIYLLGVSVDVTGVSAAATLEDGEQGLQVFATSSENVKIDPVRKLTNSFSTPLQPFSAVQERRNPGALVHLAGVVTEQRPGRMLTLSDGAIKIQALLADDFQLAPGDSVELLGFISQSPDYQIEDATVRIVAPRMPLKDSEIKGTLKTLGELKSLTVEAAAKQIPVDVRGTVTFVDPSSSLFFVQDATAAAYVDIHNTNVETHAGDFVRIQGVSAPGDYSPVITRPTITFIRHGANPKPLELSLQSLASGNSDGSWVQITGVVHSVQLQTQHSFKLAIDGNTFSVQFPVSADTTALRDRLLDAQVRVNAVCGTIFNEKRQLTGLKFLIPDAAQVQILEPAPSETDLKVRPIVTLLRFDPQNLSAHRVRIQGAVTLQEADNSFYIQDSSAAIYVVAEQKVQLRPGEKVEVSGFPVSDAEGPYLEDATVTSLGGVEEVVPVKLSSDALTTQLYDSQLVQMKGKLLERIVGSDQDTMILRAESVDLRVRLRGTNVSTGIRRGSLLEVTGVLQAEGHHGQRSFRIAMRSPSDVRVVSAASWWTPEHSVRVLALVVIATLIVLLWVAFSAYRVRLHQARHDPLTGLQNRGASLEYLERQLARAMREGSSIGVILADVDYFKRINDTLGHQTGDAVLERIAILLSADLRPYDVVGRYGGEEFLIVVPGCGPAMAKDIAERIRIRIMHEEFRNILPEENLPVTCSFGIAVPEGNSWSVDAILDYADRALYTAKNSGRNAIVLASIPSIHEPAR